MKSRRFRTILAGALLTGLAVGCATGPSPTATARRAPTVASLKAEEMELTGSYLKQRVSQSGLITDSAGHVVVIDQETIRRSGARDVREVLVKTGQNR